MNDLPDTDLTDEELIEGLNEVTDYFEEDMDKEEKAVVVDVAFHIIGFFILSMICVPLLLFLTQIEKILE